MSLCALRSPAALIAGDLGEVTAVSLVRGIRGGDTAGQRVAADLPALVISGERSQLALLRAFEAGADDVVATRTSSGSRSATTRSWSKERRELRGGGGRRAAVAAGLRGRPALSRAVRAGLDRRALRLSPSVPLDARHPSATLAYTDEEYDALAARPDADLAPNEWLRRTMAGADDPITG